MAILFDNTSIQPNSLVNFEITKQVTVAAFGLGPNEFVTFEMLAFTSPARPVSCDPCNIPAVVFPSEKALQPLMCCGNNPVRLSAQNPVVLLDAPQLLRIRAKYNGFDFSAGVPLTAEVVVYESNSTITSDAQRGCCP